MCGLSFIVWSVKYIWIFPSGWCCDTCWCFLNLSLRPIFHEWGLRERTQWLAIWYSVLKVSLSFNFTEVRIGYHIYVHDCVNVINTATTSSFWIFFRWRAPMADVSTISLDAFIWGRAAVDSFFYSTIFQGIHTSLHIESFSVLWVLCQPIFQLYHLRRTF